MPSGAIKFGTCLDLTAAVAVCGANGAWTTPLQLDRLTFERIHHPTEQQVSRGRMARLPEASVKDSAADNARVRPLAAGGSRAVGGRPDRAGEGGRPNSVGTATDEHQKLDWRVAIV